MTSLRVSSASNLPTVVLNFAVLGMLFIWISIVFWGVIFITKGMLDFNSFFAADRYYAIIYTTIGVLLLLQMRSRIRMLKRFSLTTIVKNFLEQRFLEIAATAIFMIAIAFMVNLRIDFTLNTILILPLITGTSFGFALGHFMEQTLHIPYGSFIILTSSWLLQIFWVYIFSWLVVRILLRFRLLSNID